MRVLTVASISSRISFTCAREQGCGSPPNQNLSGKLTKLIEDGFDLLLIEHMGPSGSVLADGVSEPRCSTIKKFLKFSVKLSSESHEEGMLLS
jgi:hypothetical protein